MLGFKQIGATLLGLSSLLATVAVPLGAHNLTDTAKSFLTTRAKHDVPGPPHFVIYGDKFVPEAQNGPPPVAQVRVRLYRLRYEWTLVEQLHVPGLQCFVRCRRHYATNVNSPSF